MRDPVAFLVDVVEKCTSTACAAPRLPGVFFRTGPLRKSTAWIPQVCLSRRAEAHELIERVERSLAAANPRTREAFLLHRFDGMSYAEIAQRFNISTRAVTNHIAKALILIDNELLRE